MGQHTIKQKSRRILTDKRLLFVLAGIFNTAIDFTFFNLAIWGFGLKPWVANIISTSIAMTISFFINKHAVFRDTKASTYGQLAAFLAVTIVGLWGLQTAIVVGASSVMQSLASSLLGLSGRHVQLLIPNIAKALATAVSALWNYFWYDRVIFAHMPMRNKPQEWL